VIHDVWLRFQIWYWSWRARRLARGLEPVVSVVVHAFQESSEAARTQHLDLWFGHPRDPECACRCGGRLVQLDKAGDVLAVYHMASLGVDSGE